MQNTEKTWNVLSCKVERNRTDDEARRQKVSLGSK